VQLIEELTAVLLSGHDEPVHEIPQIFFAQRGDEGEGEMESSWTRFSYISPSQQLALGFGFEEEGPRYTLADVERVLRTASLTGKKVL
jgi:hypothetical protein